jgi:mono/diheme cytochrome c family protein
LKIKTVLFGCIAFLLAGRGVQALPTDVADDTGQYDAHYEELYKSHCSACHGEHGDGKSRAEFGLNPPPRNFTTLAAREELSRERMITSVTYGRPGTAMVGWGKRLTDDEIGGIVDYIRARFMQPESPAKAEQPNEDQYSEEQPDKQQATVEQPDMQSDAHPGRQIYKDHCAVCHGEKGNGSTWTKTGLNPPPRNFTSAESREQLSPERMVTSVTYGRPGTAMMPFNTRLSKQQIASVVDYIRTTFMQGAQDDNGATAMADDYTGMPGFGHSPHAAGPATDQSPGQTPPGQSSPHQSSPHQSVSAGPATSAATSATPVDMSLPLPHGLVGDPEKGGEFYSANCFTCHGLQGNGQGPRASFIYPPPRNFLAEKSRNRLNRPALFKAIYAGIPGTVMPSWGKVLNDQQIANVAEYVFDTFIQGESAASSPQSTEPDALKKKAPAN